MKLSLRRLRRPGRSWSELLLFLGDRHGLLFILVVASVVCGLVESGILALVAQVAAALVSGGKHVALDAGLITLHETVEGLLLIGIGLAVVRLALQAVISVVPARMTADMQERMREEVFGEFTRASWREQSLDLEGHLQEILTNQVATASGGVLQATVVIVTGASFLILIISALVLDVAAALVVVGIAIVLFLVLRPLSNFGRRRAEAVSLASLDYAEGINESVRIAEEMHVFGIGPQQRTRMQRLLTAVTSPFYDTQLVGRLIPGIYQSLLYLLVVGGLLALSLGNAGHVASLGAVVLLLVRAGAYGQQAQAAQQAVRQAAPYLERADRARQRYRAARELSGTRPVKTIDRLAFEAVSFGYGPRKPVLTEFGFQLERFEAVGVIGPSGAGKSTLVQLLLRLRDPDEGEYLINGLPAREVSADDWHRLVAYVPQESHLLQASVAENIRFQRPIPDAAIERAARLAGIHDEIMTWRLGYDTPIGPRAEAVSGGQKQRISLARALAAEPELLVLDEPTSSVDPASERKIQESLAELRSRLTLVVIAHRPSTLSICDRVMVVVGGRIEAFESPDTLSLTSAYFDSVSTVTKESIAASGPAAVRPSPARISRP